MRHNASGLHFMEKTKDDRTIQTKLINTACLIRGNSDVMWVRGAKRWGKDDWFDKGPFKGRYCIETKGGAFIIHMEKPSWKLDFPQKVDDDDGVCGKRRSE